MQCKCCNKEITKQNSYSYHGNVYCAKHYQQLLKYGHTLDTNSKLTCDLNDFEIVDEHTIKIITINHNSHISGEFLISPIDFEKVIVKKWRIWKGKVYTGKYKTITIGEYLFLDKNKENSLVNIEYLNSNFLDNRRENIYLNDLQDCVEKKIVNSTH